MIGTEVRPTNIDAHSHVGLPAAPEYEHAAVARCLDEPASQEKRFGTRVLVLAVEHLCVVGCAIEGSDR